MKLLGAEILNFMAVGEAKLDLADRGLCLIQGENEDESSADSNGAGKSSIADAISWCLYGATARDESGDAVVNRTAGKDCRVATYIQDGDDAYRIVRHRKHKTGKNGLQVHQLDPKAPPGAEPKIDLTEGTEKLTQVVVERIIGCSHDVFCGAVYAGQEKMPNLPGKTDKELKMLIEEASGATLLEAAYQEANRRLREVQIALANADSLVIRSVDAHATSVTAVATAHEREKAFEETRLTQIKTWHSEGQTTKKTIGDLETALATMGDRIIIENRIAALDKKIAEVDSELDEERKLSEIASMAQSNHRDATRELENNERALKIAKLRLEELDHKVGCPCDGCDRPFLAEDIAPAKELAAVEVSKAESAVSSASEVKAKRFRALQSVAEKRDAFRAAMTDLTKTNAARTSLQAQLSKITLQESAIKGHKSDLQLVIRQIKAKKVEDNPYTADIEHDLKEVDARLKALGGAREAQVKVSAAVRVNELVAKVFSPSGVRAFLLDEVTPFLNDQTAKYLGTLSDGHITATWTTLVKTAKGELREKFSIEVDNTTGGGTFRLISGGEKRKVRIACALALQDLVARRATKPIELFIGDEIDDALDDAGRERLMTLLEEKAKERGSVFIISHSDLKDWIRQTITVRKSGGKATIEEMVD